MMLDEQLIDKLYYETFMEPNENRHPVDVLGEAYMKEQQNELVDLSYIRFAQGEVYFRAKDYETAIFKWENINNELQPWARKNMADAYFEIELFATAEEIYKLIVSDSPTLNTEIAIKLFTLYQHEGKLESAVNMIKQAVLINPDYSNVTEIARMFFEEHKDWNNAIELAVNEAVRTEKLQWVDTLINLVESGFTRSMNPEYFSQVLTMLMQKDPHRFERLAASLWKSYKQEHLYFAWIIELNRLLEDKDFSKNTFWPELSFLYQETYLDLLDGEYFIKEVADIIPALLTNWLKFAGENNYAFAAAAVLSWSDMFPASVHPDYVHQAENLLFQSDHQKSVLEDSLTLFDEIVHWSKGHGTEVSLKLKWVIAQLANIQTKHFLIAGDNGNGKASFLYSLLGEHSLESETANVFFSDHDSEEVYEINDLETHNDTFLKNKEEQESQLSNATSFREVKIPSIFLREHNLAIMTSPEISEENDENLFMADSLVFLVNEKIPFTEHERYLFMQIQKKKPDLPVHFILLKSNEGATDHLASIIKNYFPTAKLFSFKLNNTSWGELHELGEFLNGTVNDQLLEEERTVKILYFIRKMISQLIENRRELENNLIDTIKWNDQMSVKLSGAMNQLNDVRMDSINRVKKELQKVKDGMQHEVIETIPRILKECSVLIKENSDFGKIQIELNREMNDRIENYINQTLLPKFHDDLEGWIEICGKEFMERQTFLDELSDGFNTMFDEERMNLDCDFKVLDDWKRDVHRMTSSVPLEKINILNRMTPSQVFLKSAGKLFGALSQNKTMIANKYKSFIENENYFETAVSISNKVLLQIELFEKGIERDITMFFQNPSDVIDEMIEEMKNEVENNRSLLAKMDENPEIFRDPLTLFEVRLRQFEWILITDKDVPKIPR
jgi:tetratricopeptide (TPR) repeat protein